MGHGIEQDRQGGRATFVAVKDGGWHELGTVVDRPIDVVEGLDLAHLSGLDYHAERVAAVVGGQYVPANDARAVVRRNPFTRDWEVLGVVGGRYVVHTPEEVFAFGERVIEQGHPLSALGSIDNGRRAFAAFSLDGIRIGGEDQVDMFLNVLTDFTGRMNTIVRVSGIRVVCRNTFNAVHGQAELPTYRVRHAGRALSTHVDDARRALDVGWAAMEEFQREAEAFLAREVTGAEFDRIVDRLLPVAPGLGDRALRAREQARQDVRHLYEDSPTTDGVRGTAWGALNAFTEWADWTSGRYADASARMAAQVMPGSRIDKSRGRAGMLVADVLGIRV